MSKSLIDEILKKLECPVCHYYMGPPIRQCATGHSICEDCFQKVKNCPVCLNAKSNARCFGMEEIMSVLPIPCRNDTSGCTIVLEGTSIKDHEEYCEYSMRECPFKNYHRDNFCEWMGNSNELGVHCSLRHIGNYHTVNSKVLNTDLKGSCYIIFHIYDQYFRASWEVDTKRMKSKWAVYLMGAPIIAAKYFYKIEILSKNKDVGANILYQAPCSALPKDEYNIKFIENNYLSLHLDIARKYCDENNKIFYKFSVLENALENVVDNGLENVLENVLDNVDL